MATTNAARKQAARVRAKKAKSPTGGPSKVRKEMKDFDAGKKVVGKRPKKAVKKARKKGYVTPGGLVDKAAGALKARHRRIKKL